jgi:hypothetical protein
MCGNIIGYLGSVLTLRVMLRNLISYRMIVSSTVTWPSFAYIVMRASASSKRDCSRSYVSSTGGMGPTLEGERFCAGL